jgi:hypothetical protein
LLPATVIRASCSLPSRSTKLKVNFSPTIEVPSNGWVLPADSVPDALVALREA